MEIEAYRENLEPHYDNIDHLVENIIKERLSEKQYAFFDACRFKLKSIWYVQKRIEELDKQYRDFLLLCIKKNALEELNLFKKDDWGDEYLFYYPFFEAIEFEKLLSQGKACLDLFAKAIGSIYSPGGAPKNLKALVKILESKAGNPKIDKMLFFISNEYKLRGVVIDPLKDNQKSLRDIVIHYARADIFFSIRKDEIGANNLSNGALVNMKNPLIAKFPNYLVTEMAAKVWFLLIGIIENCFTIQFEEYI